MLLPMTAPHHLLLFLLLASPTATADGDGCRRCDKRGVLPCPGHTEEILEHEPEVLFCSVVAACQQCGGALLIDCKYCEGGPDDHLIAERREQVSAWVAKQRMAAFLGRPLPAVETERFQLVIDTGPLKRGKKMVDGHVIMHRIARDVQEVERLIGEHYLLPGSEAFAAKEASEADEFVRGYSSKMRMWIWKDPADHRRVMAEFLGSSSTGDFKLLGRTPLFSVWTEKEFTTEPGVRRLFSHTAPHMLLSNLYRSLWTGDIGGGWFDAGSAHWYEYKLHERSVNYCIEEATAPLDFHGGLWRAPIRKWLKKEDAPLMPPLLSKSTGAMTLPEQALCWSFYDWLVAEHVDALPEIQQGLKRKEPSRALLKKTLGLSILKIEESWRAWVAATYPTKGDEPRVPKKKRKR